MKGFNGFPQKGRLIKVPGTFFSELLPQIDHLAELKVTLYCIWRIQQTGDVQPYLRHSDFLSDPVFLGGLGSREVDRQTALADGLERAVIRGTLLHVEVEAQRHTDDLYFLNSPRGRAAVQGIESGEWSPGDDSRPLLDLRVERPNIFTLYEQNIGPLTPLIADRLHDWEDTYAEAWIEEAIEIAVKQNVRNLSYIDAVLRRWQEEGRGEITPNPKLIDSGDYWDEIEY